MARVLFTSCPAYGHVLPLLPEIRAAQRAGHDVRVATGPDLQQVIEDRGLRGYVAGPAFAESWAAHDAVWADPGVPDGEKPMTSVAALFGAPALLRLADLRGLAQEWRPDVVVHEVLEAAGPLLARELGVPGVVHGIGPMFSFYAPMIEQVGARIGRPELWEHAAAEPALDLCPPRLRPDDGPPPWPAAMPVRPSPGEPGPVPPHVAEALAKKGEVTYVTLGTVKNDVADVRTALTALAGRPGVVVATTGRPLGPEELGPVPANVALTPFVPQAAILERADLLVTHSGSGTMFGGLVHGVPQVALPRGTDQPQNAALLARSGAGVVVPPDEYAADSIRAAVAQVVGDPSYRTAAELVRDEIAAMPDADAAWARINP